MNRAHAQTQTSNAPSPAILGENVNHGLQELIRLSKKLLDFAEMETKSLVTNDHMLFAFTQRDKEALAVRYAQASEEFRGRLSDFKRADKRLLNELDRLQGELKQKTANNNALIDQIKTKASANTQATLFTAQEMGQRVSFAANKAPDEKKGA